MYIARAYINYNSANLARQRSLKGIPEANEGVDVTHVCFFNGVFVMIDGGCLMLNGRGRYRLRFLKQKVLYILLFGPYGLSKEKDNRYA